MYNHIYMMSMFMILRCEFEILAAAINEFVIDVIHEMIF